MTWPELAPYVMPSGTPDIGVSGYLKEAQRWWRDATLAYFRVFPVGLSLGYALRAFVAGIQDTILPTPREPWWRRRSGTE